MIAESFRRVESLKSVRLNDSFPKLLGLMSIGLARDGGNLRLRPSQHDKTSIQRGGRRRVHRHDSLKIIRWFTNRAHLLIRLFLGRRLCETEKSGRAELHRNTSTTSVSLWPECQTLIRLNLCQFFFSESVLPFPETLRSGSDGVNRGSAVIYAPCHDVRMPAPARGESRRSSSYCLVLMTEKTQNDDVFMCCLPSIIRFMYSTLFFLFLNHMIHLLLHYLSLWSSPQPPPLTIHFFSHDIDDSFTLMIRVIRVLFSHDSVFFHIQLNRMLGTSQQELLFIWTFYLVVIRESTKFVYVHDSFHKDSFNSFIPLFSHMISHDWFTYTFFINV